MNKTDPTNSSVRDVAGIVRDIDQLRDSLAAGARADEVDDRLHALEDSVTALRTELERAA